MLNDVLIGVVVTLAPRLYNGQRLGDILRLGWTPPSISPPRSARTRSFPPPSYTVPRRQPPSAAGQARAGKVGSRRASNRSFDTIHQPGRRLPGLIKKPRRAARASLRRSRRSQSLQVALSLVKRSMKTVEEIATPSESRRTLVYSDPKAMMK